MAKKKSTAKEKDTFHFELDLSLFEAATGKPRPAARTKGTWQFSPPPAQRHKQPFKFFDMAFGDVVKNLEQIARTHVGKGVYRLDSWN